MFKFKKDKNVVKDAGNAIKDASKEAVNFITQRRKQHRHSQTGAEIRRPYDGDSSMISSITTSSVDESTTSTTTTTGLRQRRRSSKYAPSSPVAYNNTNKEVVPAVMKPTTSKYILVGYKSEFDPTKSYLEMKRLDNVDGREIYGVSLVTVMPTEVFWILDAKLLFKRRFYAQGDATQQFTRALVGDEKRGDDKFWALDNVKPGTEISIYFAPTEGSLVWCLGSFDLNFDMPPPKEQLSAEDVSAITQFEIDNSTLSNILLMASDPMSRYVISVFRVVPHLIMLLLMIWVMQSAPKQTTVAFYNADSYLEWVNVFVIYFANVMRKAFDVGEQATMIREAFALANKVHDNKPLARGIRLGAVFEFINLLQDPIAFLLSLYVAIYLSDDVFLNVLLNVVALEFVTDVDEEMTAAYTSWRFGEGASISMALLDISYGVDETIDLWHESSNSSSEKVHDDLRKGDASNSTRWQLLISKEHGLGLLDYMEDGREIVMSVKIQLDIVEWDAVSEQELEKNGGLYLAATTNNIWENHISKRQRAVLFKHFPNAAIKFPWIGSVKLDDWRSYGSRHAGYIVEMVNTYAGVTAAGVWLDSRESDASVVVLRDGLMKNETLKVLSLCNSGLTNTGAMDVAKLLRGNSTLEFCWLLSNRGISDSGALSLAAALSDGSDANSTLHRIHMGLNNISTECQEKCAQKTNGRMVFHPDDYPNCAYFLSLPESG